MEEKKAVSLQQEITKAEEKKNLYLPCSLFGDLLIITQKKWRNATVFALEKSSVIVFSSNHISKIIKVQVYNSKIL